MKDYKDQINFFIDKELRKKIEKIKTEYTLSKILRNFLNDFHQKKYGKK